MADAKGETHNQKLARLLLSYPDEPYRRAADLIASYPTPIRTPDQARRIPGVGERISAKINDILEKGLLDDTIKTEGKGEEGI